MSDDDDWGQRLSDAGITQEQLRSLVEVMQFGIVLSETGQVQIARAGTVHFTAEQWEVMREYLESIRGKDKP